MRQEAHVSATAAAIAKLVKPSEEPAVITIVEQIEPLAEKEDTVAAPENADKQAAELSTAPVQQTATITADPYHTDVYPENVYSEEYLYDAEGNLVGKTTTIPTAFGPDTIWINGRAYYEVPGFGLVEWSGPGQRTEDYTMYESGVKIGTMGGEDEPQAQTSTAAQPTEPPEPTGEVIDQAINKIPKKSSTRPTIRRTLRRLTIQMEGSFRDPENVKCVPGIRVHTLFVCPVSVHCASFQ